MSVTVLLEKLSILAVHNGCRPLAVFGCGPENDLPSSKVRSKNTKARHASVDSRAFKRGVTKSRKARSFSGK